MFLSVVVKLCNQVSTRLGQLQGGTFFLNDN